MGRKRHSKYEWHNDSTTLDSPPYKWHINDDEEVFVVLDGVVEMRYKENNIEQSTLLNIGDIFHATVGTEHVAHPLGEARILVIESKGSI